MLDWLHHAEFVVGVLVLANQLVRQAQLRVGIVSPHVQICSIVDPIFECSNKLSLFGLVTFAERIHSPHSHIVNGVRRQIDKLILNGVLLLRVFISRNFCDKICGFTRHRLSKEDPVAGDLFVVISWCVPFNPKRRVERV